MSTFYVRPRTEQGYGCGDGKSYANAWNGFESVDWDAVKTANPATLWVCGTQLQPSTGVLAVFVEWNYSAPPVNDPFVQAIVEIASTTDGHRAVDNRFDRLEMETAR